MLAVVVVGLLASWSWIKSLEEDHRGPDSFRPPPGRYHSEVIANDGSHVLVPLEVVQVDEERVELRMPWRPPEPALHPMPPLLAAHADRIPLRIRVVSTGQVEDVVGPDEYFERVDDDDPEAADALRALLLEEQVETVLAWQLTAYISRPLLEGSTFSFEAGLPGYGMAPDWQGTIDFDVEAEGDCPEPAGEERCMPITLRSRHEADGRDEITGRLLVGVDTGLEWQATLVRDSGDRRREVRRRLLPVDR